MLILFDIDGTLFRGRGTGRLAFTRAAAKLFGPEVVDPAIDYSGRLDPWIMGKVLETNGIAMTPELGARFREECHVQLRDVLTSGEFTVEALPGTHRLVERLATQTELTLGLLTGNWEPNGWLKIESVGFERTPFVVNAWGDDGPTRNDLVPVAHQRYRTVRADLDALPSNTLIIGDTIHDVRCAKAHDCLSLAVLTGGHSAEQITPESPDRLVEDLSNTDDLVDWIMSFAAPVA